MKTVWKRERLVGTFTSKPMQYPMDKISVAVSPFLPTKDFSHQCFKVSNESIERLKMSSMKENANKEITKKKGFTTYETIAAHIWRSRARALKLNYDGETMLIIIVGIKPHLLDPLPSGYYGNTIVESYVVKLIRERTNDGFSSDYIRHTIDSMETKPMKFNYESGAIMNLTDWRHLGYLKNVDFGWKEPLNTMPVPRDINGSRVCALYCLLVS